MKVKGFSELDIGGRETCFFSLMSYLLVSSSSVMACSPGDSGPPMLVVTAYSEPGQAAQTNFPNIFYRHVVMSCANCCKELDL